jgi:hypothetical protein
VVRVAVIVGAAVTVVALPFVFGFGRAPDNPSILPLNYGRNLALLLLGLAALTALVLGRHRIRTVLGRFPVRGRPGRSLAGRGSASRARLRDSRKDSERRNAGRPE